MAMPDSLLDRSLMDERNLLQEVGLAEKEAGGGAEEEEDDDDDTEDTEDETSTLNDDLSEVADDVEEMDYSDFKFVEGDSSQQWRVTMAAEKVTVDNISDWRPPVFEKTPAESAFLAAQLATLFYLKETPRRLTKFIVDALEPISLLEGARLCNKGEPAEHLYIVQEGSLDYVVITETKKQQHEDLEESLPSTASSSFARRPRGKEELESDEKSQTTGLTTFETVVRTVPGFINLAHHSPEPTRCVAELALLHSLSYDHAIVARTDVSGWKLKRRTFQMVQQHAMSKQRQLYAGFLAKVPLFKDLSEAKKNIICDALRTVDYSPGDDLIVEGDPGDDFFIIEEGTVECLKMIGGEQIRVCPPLKVGAFFGELALLRDAPRSATVRALENVSVVRIGKSTFDRTIGKLDAVYKKNYEGPPPPLENKKEDRKKSVKKASNASSEESRSSRRSSQRRRSRKSKGGGDSDYFEKDNPDGTLVGDVYSDSSEDDEDDYKDFKFYEQRDPEKQRAGVTAEAAVVEEDWNPPYIEKGESKIRFLTENLTKLFFLSHLTRKEVRVLVDAMRPMTYGSNYDLIKQGDQGDTFYIVEKGKCIVTINGVGKVMEIPALVESSSSSNPAAPVNKKRREQVAASSNGNNARRHVGELALLYDKPRGANVITVGEVKAWCLDRKTFQALMKSSSQKQRVLYAGFIAKVPLFRDLSQEKKNVICDAMVPVDYREGDVIVKEGDGGDDFFIIEEGTVECLQNGKRVSGGVLSATAFFGELALLHDLPRAATVRALEDVSVVKVGRPTFDRVIGLLDALRNKEYDRPNSRQKSSVGSPSSTRHSQLQQITLSSSVDPSSMLLKQPRRSSGNSALVNLSPAITKMRSKAQRKQQQRLPEEDDLRSASYASSLLRDPPLMRDQAALINPPRGVRLRESTYRAPPGGLNRQSQRGARSQGGSMMMLGPMRGLSPVNRSTTMRKNGTMRGGLSPVPTGRRGPNNKLGGLTE